MYLDQLDRLDQKILTLLIENARYSYSEIGERIGISRVAVKARIDALEKRGLLKSIPRLLTRKKSAERFHAILKSRRSPRVCRRLKSGFAAMRPLRRFIA